MKRILLFLVFFLVLPLFSIRGYATWTNVSYAYRLNYTLGSVVASSLTNFPRYISVDTATPIGASKMQSDCDDIAIYDNSNNLLAYEFENRTDATYGCNKATTLIWVKIPSYTSSNTTNIISLYYGNSTISSGQNSVNVWDADYHAVWHMASVPNNDSTSWKNNLTKSGSPILVAGKIGNAVDNELDTVDYQSLLTQTGLDINKNLTTEAWVKRESVGTQVIIGSRTAFDQAGVMVRFSNGAFLVQVSANGGWNELASASAEYTGTTIWYYVVFTYKSVSDGSSEMRLYVNGTQRDSLLTANEPIDLLAEGLWQISGRPDAGQYFDGLIDEVRISNAVRTADWVKQSYEIVNSYSALTTVGTEETPTPPNTAPIWSSNQSSTPANYSLTTYSTFNVTWSDDSDTNGYNFSYLEINNTNYTATRPTGTNRSEYEIILGAGTYAWRFYANDSSNAWNKTDQWIFTINNLTPTISLSNNVSWNANYLNVSNTSGEGCPVPLTCNFYRNGTSISNPDIALFGVGSYVYVFNTTGNSNYSSYTVTNTLIINKATPAINLYFNGSENNVTLTYPATVNITGIADHVGLGELYRNDTKITNNFNYDGITKNSNFSTFGGNTCPWGVASNGTHIFVSCYGSSIYYIYDSSGSNVKNFTGGSADSYDLFWNGTNFLIGIGAGGNGINVRNSSFSSVGDIDLSSWVINLHGVYADNKYLYILDAQIGDDRDRLLKFLHDGTLLPPSAGFLNVSSDGTRNDSTSLWMDDDYFYILNQTDYIYFYDRYTYAHVGDIYIGNDFKDTYGITGIGDYLLISSDILNSIGNFSLTSTKTTNRHVATINDKQAVGVYNYTYYFYGNDNYTSASETLYVTINKGTPDIKVYIDNVGENKTVSYPTTVTIKGNSTTTVTPPTFNLYVSALSASGNPSTMVTDLSAGTHKIVYNTSGDANWSAASNDTIYLTVNKATPTFSTSVTSPIIYETASNYAGSESNTGDADCSYNLSRNETEIDDGSSVSDNTIIGIGTWNYTYYTDGCTNYTFNKDERILTINIKNINIYSALNNTQNNKTYTYPNSVVNATAWKDSTLNNEGTVTLLRDNVIKASGQTATEILRLGSENYNYSATFSASNYSATNILADRFAIISNQTPSLTILTNGTATNKTAANIGVFNVSGNGTAFDVVTYNLYNSTHLLNSGNNTFNITNSLSPGEYQFIYNTSGNQNTSSGSTNIYVNIFSVTNTTSMQNTTLTGLTTNTKYNVTWKSDITFNNSGSSVNNVTYNYTISSDFTPYNINVSNSTNDNTTITVSGNNVNFTSENIPAISNKTMTVYWVCRNCTDITETVKSYTSNEYSKGVTLTSSLTSIETSISSLIVDVPNSYDKNSYDLNVYKGGVAYSNILKTTSGNYYDYVTINSFTLSTTSFDVNITAASPYTGGSSPPGGGGGGGGGQQPTEAAEQTNFSFDVWPKYLEPDTLITPTIPGRSNVLWDINIYNYEVDIAKILKPEWEFSCNASYKYCLSDWCSFTPKDGNITTAPASDHVTYLLNCSVPKTAKIGYDPETGDSYEYRATLLIWPYGYNKNISLPVRMMIRPSLEPTLSLPIGPTGEFLTSGANAIWEGLTYPIVCLTKTCTYKNVFGVWPVFNEPVFGFIDGINLLMIFSIILIAAAIIFRYQIAYFIAGLFS